MSYDLPATDPDANKLGDIRREYREHRWRLQKLDMERSEIVHAMEECEMEYHYAGGDPSELD